MCISQFIQTTTKSVSIWYGSQGHVHLPVYTNDIKHCLPFVSISTACTSPSLYKRQQRVPPFRIDLNGMYISQFIQTTTVSPFGMDLNGINISQFMQATTKIVSLSYRSQRHVHLPVYTNHSSTFLWYRSQGHVHLPVYTNHNKELLVSISAACTSPSLYKPQQYLSLVSISKACTSPSLYKPQQRVFGINLSGINISQFIQTTTVSSFGINLVYSIPPVGACSCGTDRKRKSRQTCKNQQSGSADTESCHLQRGQDTSPLSVQWRLEETQRWISGTT